MLVNASVLPLGVVHRVPSIIAMAKPTMIISFFIKKKTEELLGKSFYSCFYSANYVTVTVISLAFGRPLAVF